MEPFCKHALDIATVLETEELVSPRNLVHRDLLGEPDLRICLRPEPMQQAVCDDNVGLDIRRPIEALDAHRVEQREHEAKARDGDRVGVDVDAIDLVERAAREIGNVLGRRLLLPAPNESAERAEEEVTRAAGRVEEAHVLEAELCDGRVQRLVEDELLDKLRRLEEREALAHGFGEILVQVPKKARVSAREHQRRRATCIALAEEIEQSLCSLARWRQHPYRVVTRVEHVARTRELGQLSEDR